MEPQIPTTDMIEFMGALIQDYWVPHLRPYPPLEGRLVIPWPGREFRFYNEQFVIELISDGSMVPLIGQVQAFIDAVYSWLNVALEIGAMRELSVLISGRYPGTNFIISAHGSVRRWIGVPRTIRTEDETLRLAPVRQM